MFNINVLFIIEYYMLNYLLEVASHWYFIYWFYITKNNFHFDLLSWEYTYKL